MVVLRFGNTGTWWKSLLNTITFGLVYRNTVEVKVCGTDALSGVDKYYYYIDDSGNTTPKTASELARLTFQSVNADGSNAVTVTSLANAGDTKNYVVYAYAVDKVGNRSEYICSNGVVVDDEAPTLTLSTPAKDDETLTDSSATVTLNASEAGTYFYILQENGEIAPSGMDAFATSSTANGKTTWTAKSGITSGSMAEGNNSLSLTGLDANTKYTLYVVAVDSVGNATANVQSQAFTTLKLNPTITVQPKITGTYGQKLSEMNPVAGTAAYNDTPVTGTWAITDTKKATDYPTVRGTTAYEVTFTPADTDTYETITVKVIPTVAKKSVTVTADNKTKTYGEANPELTFTVPKDALVGTDEKADLGVTLSCEAGKYSAVKEGGYAITGTSDSANYEVTVTPGVLTVAKADAEITVSKSSYEVTYGVAPFNLGITDTNRDEDVKYEVTSGADSIEVSKDGVVTIKSAKTTNATITVTLSASTNYNAAPKQTITINIAKKTYGNEITLDKTYPYSDPHADTIDISALLPKDCGAATYAIPDGRGTYDSSPEVDRNGNLSYTVSKGNIGDKGDITVTVTTDNYNSITITVNWQRTDKYPVILKPNTSVTLKDSVLTYGQPLSVLKFYDAVFVSENNPNQIVSGTLAWTTPDAKPIAGTPTAQWTFTPDAKTFGDYATLDGNVNITVNQAKPKLVTAPTVNTTYHPGTKLSDFDLNTAGANVTAGTVNGIDGSTLSGSWSWETSDQTPGVNNSGYEATFTPDDTSNYEPVTCTITVTVAKATPYIATVPTAAEITYGETLGSSALTGGTVQYSDSDTASVEGNFVWERESTIPKVSDSNTTSYTVIFKPTASDNYNEVETNITITVNKAENAPNMPGSTMSVANSCKTVGAVELPRDWEWNTGEAAKTLTVGVPLKATAVYKGADKGNYENESVEITITRSRCFHKNTTLISVKAASCMEKGYSGDTYCNDCKTVIESGRETDYAEHKGGTATCKKRAVCDNCHQEYGSTDPNNHVAREVRGHRDAGCTSGYTGDTYCADCENKIQDGTTIAALGHDYKSEVTTEPTTTSTGVRTYTCNRCNHTYTETIAKLPEEAHNHSYTENVTRQADCTNAGVKTYTCSCGDSYTESIPALGHHYISKVTKQATTTEEGIMTYTCDRCGHSYTRAIAKLANSGDKPGNDNRQDNTDKPGSDGQQDNTGKPDTGKPYIKGRADKNGWENIKDRLDDVKEKDTVTVDMNGTTVVPGDVFDTIRGKDVNVVFDMGDGITWTVNGKDITADKAGDINFGVTVGSQAGKTIPVDIINNVTGERYSVNVTLAYDGELGFKATLSLNVGKENAGLYANLFYYNPEKNSLEYRSAGIIDEEGNAHLDFTHASDYSIVIDTEDMKTADIDSASDASTVPVTAEDTDAWNPWWIIIIGAVLLIVGIGVFFVAKKKRETEE